MRKFLVGTVLGLLMVFGSGSLVLAANSNNEVPANSGNYFYDAAGKVAAPLTKETNNVLKDNANDTGSGVNVNDGSKKADVIKSDNMKDNNGTEVTQRTHGEYQNNTNSCASCHQTHTASAKSLLFQSSVYNTCTACHDGTLGFYDVFSPSTAGTFGGNHSGNASVHLSTGAMKVSSAPGGLTNTNDPKLADSKLWGAEFNCASCHSAHGSYSDRLLNYNPNNMGNTVPVDGGIKAVDAPVIDYATSITTSTTGVKDASNKPYKYILVKGTATDFAIDNAKIGANKVLLVYELSGTKYAMTTNPWLYGYDRVGDPVEEVYWTNLVKSDGSKFDYKNQVDIKIDYANGYAYGTAVDSVVKGNIARAYKVVMDKDTIGTFGTIDITTINEAAFQADGKGKAISAFCAACHTDYMAKSSATATSGTFNQAYRHTTNNDGYNCLRCHFAHGTDVSIMKDAEGRTIADLQIAVDKGGKGWSEDQAKAYMVDKNPSSALKRYTNMTACYGCHTDSKASQLKNNSYFMNEDNENPHGLN